MPDESATSVLESAEPAAPPQDDSPEPEAQHEPDAEPAPEGGAAPETSEETPDLRVQAEGLLGDIKQLYPDLFPEPAEHERADTTEDVELARFQLERDRRQTQGEALYQQEYGTVRQKPASSFRRVIENVQQLGKGEIDNIPQESWKTLATDIDSATQEARTLGEAWSDFQNEEYILEALETHPSRRLVTKEERDKLQALPPGTPRREIVRAHIHAFLDAALSRGAPEEAKRQAKKEAEEAAGLAQKMAKLSDLLPKNGAVTPEVSAPTRGRDRDWAETAPISDLIKDRARRGA